MAEQRQPSATEFLAVSEAELTAVWNIVGQSLTLNQGYTLGKILERVGARHVEGFVPSQGLESLVTLQNQEEFNSAALEPAVEEESTTTVDAH